MSAHHVAALDALRAALTIDDVDAPVETIMSELRALPHPIAMLAIEVALSLLDTENEP